MNALGNDAFSFFVDNTASGEVNYGIMYLNSKSDRVICQVLISAIGMAKGAE